MCLYRSFQEEARTEIPSDTAACEDECCHPVRRMEPRTSSESHRQVHKSNTLNKHIMEGFSLQCIDLLLQINESVRVEKSEVVLYCFQPVDESSSINDAQIPVGQIPPLSSLADTQL